MICGITLIFIFIQMSFACSGVLYAEDWIIKTGRNKVQFYKRNIYWNLPVQLRGISRNFFTSRWSSEGLSYLATFQWTEFSFPHNLSVNFQQFVHDLGLMICHRFAFIPLPLTKFQWSSVGDLILLFQQFGFFWWFFRISLIFGEVFKPKLSGLIANLFQNLKLWGYGFVVWVYSRYPF